MGNFLQSVFDLVQAKWSDLIALALVVLGAALTCWGHDEASKDVGKGLYSAGLLGLSINHTPQLPPRV
jgi:hypothetical protein